MGNGRPLSPPLPLSLPLNPSTPPLQYSNIPSLRRGVQVGKLVGLTCLPQAGAKLRYQSALVFWMNDVR